MKCCSATFGSEMIHHWTFCLTIKVRKEGKYKGKVILMSVFCQILVNLWLSTWWILLTIRKHPPSPAFSRREQIWSYIVALNLKTFLTNCHSLRTRDAWRKKLSISFEIQQDGKLSSSRPWRGNFFLCFFSISFHF